MLPPARDGVSSCSISALMRAARPGFSERSSTLFERGSATIITRCCASPGCPPCVAVSAPTSRFNIGTRSIADAFLSVTMIGSPEGAWSSDAMILSMRRRLSAKSVMMRELVPG